MPGCRPPARPTRPEPPVSRLVQSLVRSDPGEGWMSSYKNTMLIATVIAALAGLVAIIVAVWPSDSDQPSQTNTAGSNSCIVNGSASSCTVNSGAEILSDPNAEWKEIQRQLLEAGKGRVPTGTGPWQFAVLGTGNLGLKVRNDPGRSGVQIGSLGEKSTAWVDCQLRNDFDAGGAGGPGPIWYRVRWPNQSPTSAFFNSEPASPYIGWAYKGYLTPVGQDGSVPQCTNG